jgi:pimeloyl-ACP methyl ester carboxylesterase
MTTFVLIPGAGGVGAFFHLLVPELERRGHTAVAVDIREDDPALGLPQFADVVEAAIPQRAGADVILVAQSMGAFTAPMVAARRPVRMIVLLNPMTPVPGEILDDWWKTTGQEAARVANDRAAGRSEQFTLETHFLHDVPPAALTGVGDRDCSATPWAQPCAFEGWGEPPVRAIISRDDRLFPLAFQRRVIAERVGIVPDEVAGGHLSALSNPVGIAERLCAYARE